MQLNIVDILLNVVAAWLLVLSMALSAISWKAYLRSRNPRIAYVTGAFAVMTAEGIVFSYDLFRPYLAFPLFFALIGLLNTLVLLLIFLATLKR